MINQFKAWLLRRKAKKLEAELADLLRAEIIAAEMIKAAIIHKRGEAVKIQRKLQALGSMA